MATPQLIKRALGATGMMVSPIGLGTVKFGRNEKVKYPQPFDLPDEKFLAGFLETAKSYGINLIDTAPSYGLAEERLGRLLQGQRQDWVIVGKVGENFKDGQSSYDFSVAGILQSVEESLQRLKTDYLDVLLLHATAGDEELLDNYEVLGVVTALKQAGKIRAHGLSTYSNAAGMRAADLFDVLMVSYNLGWRTEENVINKAAAKNVGILIKKAFNSGHLDTSITDPVTETFKLLFAKPAVSAAIIGTINPDHLDDNVRKAAAVAG